MKKIIRIVSVVLVLAAVGVGGYWYQNKMASASTTTSGTTYTQVVQVKQGSLDATVSIVGELEGDARQISGLYTRLMRDEVLAELAGSGSGGMEFRVYCHVSGGLVLGPAGWRNEIFHRHMRMVLEALRYGERELLSAHPELDEAKILVHFASNHDRYNKVEDWGQFQSYG